MECMLKKKCVITDLWCDQVVVAEPRDLRLGVGLSVTVEITRFTLF